MKRNSIADMKEEMSAWRRELHQNPGLAYEEDYSSDFVAKHLEAWGIPFKRGLGKTGIVATIEGETNTSGRRIGFRGDMDALPIIEASGVAHASKKDGVMHACGHDGHTSIALGVAKYLNENRAFDGTVHVIFQPAEEGAGGAEAMMADGLFKDFPCDEIYGLHNWPWLPVGKAGLRVGPFLAAVDEFEVVVTGIGGHAANPHKCVDPVVTAASLITDLQTIISRNVEPSDPAVITVTNLNVGGGAFNVIADQAMLSGTVRTFKPETRILVEKRFREMCAGVAQTHGAKIEVTQYNKRITATINTPQETDYAERALKNILGDENVDTNFPLNTGGEDFGAFLEKIPGAYIALGQGTGDAHSPHDQGLHSNKYDFNDDILPIAVDYVAEIVDMRLPLKKAA